MLFFRLIGYRFFVILLFFLIFHHKPFAQELTGIITDKRGEAIPNALITLLYPNDSSIINYASSKLDGIFKIKIIKEKIILTVRCLGFFPFIKELSITKEIDPLKIVLDENPVLLNEFVIKGKYVGIQHQNDTISYDPKMFVDGSEVTLGDLLSKMPGINVDTKGNVKAQGKEVSSVLINGIDHFAGNVSLATKNVSADIADKIEIFHNYGEYSLLDGFKTNNQTAINIGVDKNRIGKISGDATIGGGIKDRYSSRLNVMQIQPRYMVSYLGGINNNGDQLFGIDDYFQMKGGINEVMGKEGRFNISEEERKLLSPSDNTYETTMI